MKKVSNRSSVDDLKIETWDANRMVYHIIKNDKPTNKS